MLIEPPPTKGSHSNNQPKQNPLYFTNPLIDSISRSLTTFGGNQTERIIYMGPRYTSNLKLLRAFSSSESRTQNKVNDSEIFGQEQVIKYTFLNHQKQKYYPIRSNEYRLFNGVNPTAKKDELRFDSNFECGNLDLVVSLGDGEYDLFMKVDSNTKGHTCWFFFKVQNYADSQRVKFNLANFSRSELSFESGMKVYTYASSAKEWVQSGENILFSQGHKYKYIDREISDELSEFQTLSFEYQFKFQDEFTYFAYCIPYSYSYLEFKITQLQKKYSKIVQIDRSNLSAGGLSIPILTVTNKNINEAESSKEVCLIIGRLHPGESQGSWILHGFLNFLCSPKAKQLRNKILFKIIPMVNVDGVIAGNFRTNLLGRDLNRYFHKPHDLCQIGLIRSLASKFKPFMFLDFHGHSSRKNIFTYGPDYPIDHRYFLSSRAFPKLISKCTKTFRYYSCNFRISQDKSNTGRAVMLRNHQVIYCFTIEGSAYAYGPRKDEILFDRGEYIQAGSMICTGLDKFIKVIFALPKRYQFALGMATEKLKQKSKSFRNMQNNSNMSQVDTTPQNKKLFQQILSDQRQKSSFQLDREKISLLDSDFEEDNDYSEKQLIKMLKVSQQVSHVSSKKVKRYHEKLSSNNSHKNHSLHFESNTKIQAKSKVLGDQVINDSSYKKLKQLRRIKNSPDLHKNHSQSLQLNIELHPSPERQSVRLRGRHIKTLFSEESCIITVNPVKLQNLNHLSLDYSVNKTCSEYEPLSEAKRIKEKTSILVKKRKGIQELRLAEQSQQNKRRQKMNNIKKSLLPLLGTNMCMKKEQGISHIEQIFERRELQRKNRINRQIKIMYS